MIQTIALFRFQVRRLKDYKTVGFLIAMYVSAFAASQFVAELAIVESVQVVVHLFADLVRYGGVIVVIVLTCHLVTVDYEQGFFERIFAMPVLRYQYLLSQQLVLLVLCGGVVIPVFFLFPWIADIETAIYWGIAVFLELLLFGQIALLAAVSLERLPSSILLSLTMAFLIKVLPVIELMSYEATNYTDEEPEFSIMRLILGAIKFILPNAKALAENDQLFYGTNFERLFEQFLAVAIFMAFIHFVVLLDFYRKEFVYRD